MHLQGKNVQRETFLLSGDKVILHYKVSSLDMMLDKTPDYEKDISLL